MFKIFTTEELINYIKQFKFTRMPKELHWHHTWRPNHSNFNDSNHIKIQEGMKNSHMNDRGWSDIGQHLTLFPDGKWVTGRDFNRDPASIEGRNKLGFAIEMVGNFDKGNDKLEGKQLESAIKFGAFMQNYFKLTHVFHNEYANKSCPGTSIDKKWFVGLIQKELIKPERKVVIIDKNGKSHNFDMNKTKLEDGRYYFEGREFCELAGGTVSYNNETKTSTFDFSK